MNVRDMQLLLEERNGSAGRTCGPGSRKLQIDGNRDVVADHRAPSLEQAVVDQAEIAPIDRRPGGGADPPVPPDVLDFRRRPFDLERDPSA